MGKDSIRKCGLKRRKIVSEEAKKRYTKSTNSQKNEESLSILDDHCRRCDKDMNSNLLKSCNSCSQHCVCSSCLTKCIFCDKFTCTSCKSECNECEDKMCEEHLGECGECGNLFCSGCLNRSCVGCGLDFCSSCTYVFHWDHQLLKYKELCNQCSKM